MLTGSLADWKRCWREAWLTGSVADWKQVTDMLPGNHLADCIKSLILLSGNYAAWGFDVADCFLGLMLLAASPSWRWAARIGCCTMHLSLSFACSYARVVNY